jgi:hypothetical protein
MRRRDQKQAMDNDNTSQIDENIITIDDGHHDSECEQTQV